MVTSQDQSLLTILRNRPFAFVVRPVRPGLERAGRMRRPVPVAADEIVRTGLREQPGMLEAVLGYVPATAGFKHPFGGCRIPGKLALRADWASDQFAAAVGAHTQQYAGCAGPAEGALERADHGLFGIRRQVPVTALAIRSKLKHRVPPVGISKIDTFGTRNLGANARSHNGGAQAQILTKFPFTVCPGGENISTGCQGCVSIAWCMREGDSDRLVENGPVMNTGAPSAQSSHLESSVQSSAALIARQQIGWQPWRLTFSALQERGAVSDVPPVPGRRCFRRCRRATIPV